jgi:hypothetical protein
MKYHYMLSCDTYNDNNEDAGVECERGGGEKRRDEGKKGPYVYRDPHI